LALEPTAEMAQPTRDAKEQQEPQRPLEARWAHAKVQRWPDWAPARKARQLGRPAAELAA